jgi:ribosomal protein S18 acetylase RimI-like enzyme
MHIRPYQPADQATVIDLWRRCDLVRAWNDPHKDIARKLKVNAEWFLVGEMDGRIVATVMAGYEGHRGWINYLAVDPAQRRHGLGRMLMKRAEELLRAAGCPKINLQIRSGNEEVIAFYRSLGYQVDPVNSMGKRLDQDGPRPGWPAAT